MAGYNVKIETVQAGKHTLEIETLKGRSVIRTPWGALSMGATKKGKALVLAAVAAGKYDENIELMKKNRQS